ncbi:MULTISPECIES: DNA-binding protein [Streptomyces]|uniref:DNA-binding protein n=1 Tax=Streptomyces lichenis TaxID=2306967 RepID=A0ABT0IHK1_9ACTN|nr:DNA-binding protein [Streptomyces lichenis]MCK8680796.1 DNA-binding protein [Streptomyces lichenis]
MDRSGLIEATVRKAAQDGGGLGPEDVGRVVDALFGTVEHSGSIAEAIRAGQTVALLGFGDFHAEDGAAALRPGKALVEFLRGSTG